MWSFLAGKVLRNRFVFLLIVAAFTAFMGYKAQFIEMSYEYAALLPETDSVFIDMADFKKTFGEDANVMVAGFKDDNFFQKEKFNDWQELTQKLKAHKSVVNVFSVSEAYSVSKDALAQKFKFKKIFPEKVNSQAELDSLKNVLYEYPFFDNLVYIKDSSFFIVALTLDPVIINSKKREGLMDEIEAEIRAFGKKHNLELKLSGLPYTRTRIALMIQSELYMFVVLAMLVTALILFLFFRSFKVVAFSMLIVGAGVIWSLGTLALLKYQITILTAMIPPLIIVIGIPNSVFLLNKYHNEFKQHGNKMKALHRVISKVGNATFLTNLTTAAGFATFIVTGNSLLVEFGIVASLNIMGVFVLSITLIPVFFSFLPEPKNRHVRHLDYKLVDKIVSWFVHVVSNKRTVVYTTVFILTIGAGVGITQMRTQGFIIDDIPKDNPIYTDLIYFEDMTGGVMPFEITVKKRNGDTLEYADINRINRMQDTLRTYSFFTKSLSIAEALKFANQAFYNGKEKAYRFPKLNEVSRLEPYIGNMSGENSLIKSFVDSSFSTARLSVRVKDIGMKEMTKLQKKLRTQMDSVFPKETYKSTITGSSVVFTQGTAHLINNLFVSLALAVLLISVFMASMFASFRMIIVSLIPNLLPLTFTAALMGYFNIPLKPSTILIFSIAFGISVDNAIHFLAKYRQELSASKWNIGQSVIKALKETGVSIVYTATILFLGFGIFTQSEFGGTVALGILVSVTLLFALLSNLIFLPSLLLSLEKRITTSAFETNLLKHINDEDEDENGNGNQNGTGESSKPTELKLSDVGLSDNLRK